MTELRPRESAVGQGAHITGVGTSIFDTRKTDCLVHSVANQKVADSLAEWKRYFQICFHLLRQLRGSFIRTVEDSDIWNMFSPDQKKLFQYLAIEYQDKPIPRDTDERWKQFDTDHEWIWQRSGIGNRFWANDGVASSDLGAQAAEKALAISGLGKQAIDFIIVATTTPDHPQTPLTATLIMEKLGIKAQCDDGLNHVFCVDVSDACSSYIAALQMGHALIHSGKYRTGLVIGTDVMEASTSPYDRNLRIILSSGAFCAVLEVCDASHTAFHNDRFLMGADGSLAGLITVPAGGSRWAITPGMIVDPFNRQDKMWMDGNLVMKKINRLLVSSDRQSGVVIDALRQAGIGMGDIRLVCPHQANIRMLNKLSVDLTALGFQGKFCSNIDRFGNLTSGATGYCLDEAWQNGWIKKGDLIMLIAFGGGLTWGVSIFEWTLGSYPDSEFEVYFK